jgi:hypothetical protein
MLFNMEQEMSRSGEDCLLQLAAVARATEEMFRWDFWALLRCPGKYVALKFQWRNFLSENQAALLYLNSRGFTNDTAFHLCPS